MNDEPEIIQACLRGDRERYGTLVDRHAGAVRAFLLTRLGSPERAEEAAQEAFVRGFAGLGWLRDPGRFVSWVLGIAAKVATEEGRRRKAWSVAGDVRETDGGAGNAAEVDRLVAGLPEPYRGAIWLRYWAGLSCEAAAREQGVSVGTFTKRLSRAHELLRGAVKGRDGEGKERIHELR